MPCRTATCAGGGARFDDRVIGNPKHFMSVERKIIHIDIDPSSISKRVKVDVPIVGDVKEVLTELISMIREASARPDAAALGQWWETIEGWRSRDCLQYSRGDGSVIKPQYVVETLWNMTRDADAYITSDVGQHTRCGLRSYYRFRRTARRWINSAAWAQWRGPALRHGLQVAKPESEVFCITGEGSIQMNIQELATCLQYNTPVKGGVAEQTATWAWCASGRRSSTRAAKQQLHGLAAHFVKLAEAYGHVGMLIERPEDVEPALREARKLKDRTVFHGLRVPITENVVPHGAGRPWGSPRCCWELTTSEHGPLRVLPGFIPVASVPVEPSSRRPPLTNLLPAKPDVYRRRGGGSESGIFLS